MIEQGITTMRSQLGRTMSSEDRATLMEAALQVKSIWDAEELRRTFFRFRNVGVMAWRKFLDDAEDLLQKRIEVTDENFR